MTNLFKFSQQPQFENPSLIVTWNEDAGKLGPGVVEYLNRKIKSKDFCEIEPAGFFAMEGVTIENNVAHFPESRFYYSEQQNLIIFKGSEPQFDRYKFLNAILDVAEHCCNVQELFIVSGTVSSIAHTTQRRILAVYSQQVFQKKLRGYGLEDMDWKGPPATSSYLLWVAKQRGIPAVCLWPTIPFYLASVEDSQAIKLTLSFFNKRFDLNMDLRELDKKLEEQYITIADLREEDLEINEYIETLESGLPLNQEEQMELIKGITDVLEKKD